LPVALFSQSNTHTLDSRAMGMGSAYVADSPLNPANLGFRGDLFFGSSKDKEGATDRNGAPTFMMNLYAGGEYVVSGSLLKLADDVNDIVQRNGGIDQFQSTFSGTPTREQIRDGFRLVNALAQLDKDKNAGAFMDANTHLDIFFQNLGLYFDVWGHAGIQPRVDTNNFALSTALQMAGNPTAIWGQGFTGDPLSPSQQSLAQTIDNENSSLNLLQAQEMVRQAAAAGINTDDPLFQEFFRNAIRSTSLDGSTINNNDSGVRVLGLVMGEFNLSYGQSLFDIVSFGINLKVLQARLYDEQIVLRNISKVEDLYKDLLDGTYFDKKVRTYERFDLDLGFTVRPPGLGLSVSFLAKNLIPYSLKYPSGGSIDIATQYRAGVSWQISDILSVAFDADLNPIHYDTIKYKAQTIAGGVEFAVLPKPSVVELLLRAGAFKNVADENQDAIITTGLGVKFWKFAIDAGGQVSWFKKVTIRSGSNEVDVFERAGFGVNVIFATDF
jgi:hypothetical protein